MKSPMIENANYVDKKDFSDLQVCCSGGGWYIGTVYTDPETGDKEPGSRDTEYFPTQQEADIQLMLLVNGGSKLTLRMTP